MINNLVDYHIHTSLCNHADGTMKEYVKSSIEVGLKEMGFSDHNPLPPGYDGRFRMRSDDMNIYLDTIADLQEFFPEIRIKTGIELDFIEGAIDYLRDFVARYNFDYVTGSVHYMENGVSNQLDYLSIVDSEPKTERFRQYFSLIGKAAASGIFDIIAHFDLPKRFWGGLDAASYEFAEQALKKIKQNDLCIEVNTSGFRTKNVDEPFPEKKLLQLARQMGISVTLGSDSHKPKHVASCFREAVKLLKVIGFEKIAVFNRRKRQFVPI